MEEQLGGSTDAPLSPLLHEVKLPGLGAGGSKQTGLSGGSTDAPLSPLLHEVKLPDLGAGGSKQEGLRHEPKLSLHHEVILVRSSCQESNFRYTGDSSLRLLLPLLLLLVIASLHSSKHQKNVCLCSSYFCDLQRGSL